MTPSEERPIGAGVNVSKSILLHVQRGRLTLETHGAVVGDFRTLDDCACAVRMGRDFRSRRPFSDRVTNQERLPRGQVNP